MRRIGKPAYLAHRFAGRREYPRFPRLPRTLTRVEVAQLLDRALIGVVAFGPGVFILESPYGDYVVFSGALWGGEGRSIIRARYVPILFPRSNRLYNIPPPTER